MTTQVPLLSTCEKCSTVIPRHCLLSKNFDPVFKWVLSVSRIGDNMKWLKQLWLVILFLFWVDYWTLVYTRVSKLNLKSQYECDSIPKCLSIFLNFLVNVISVELTFSKFNCVNSWWCQSENFKWPSECIL